MSIGWMKWAFDQEVDPPAKFVLVVLADHADQDGWCYPSIERMRGMTGYADKTIRRHLEALVEVGVVSRWKNPNGPHDPRCYEYRLHEYRSERPLSSDLDTGRSDHSPNQIVVTPSTDTGQSDHEYRSERPPNRHRTIIEPSNTPSLPQTGSTENESQNAEEGDIHRDDGLEGFDEFWDLYPRKVEKWASKRAWRKLDDGDRAAVMAVLPLHAEAWKKAKKEARFIPHPSTWLNGRRWEDEDFEMPPPGPIGERPKPYFIDADGVPRSRHHR